MRQILNGFVGNNALKSKILSDVLSDNLSHAYILEGNKGSGRHTVAKMIAAALSCENRNNSNMPLPCTTCPACKKILEDKSPDVITVSREDKASLGIEAIRFLKNDVSVVPNELDYKIYIIEDADTMTIQAQNAFLLTLEEPPSFVKYFLICEDSSGLLETIHSRVQTLHTELIPNEDIDKLLLERYPAARTMKTSQPELYGELIMASQNTVGKAISMLDEKSFKSVLEDRLITKEIIRLLTENHSSEDVISIVAKLDTKRDELRERLTTLLLALRDLIVLTKSDEATLVFFGNREYATSLTELISLKKLFFIYDSVTATTDSLAANANVRLSIINLFSKIGLL